MKKFLIFFILCIFFRCAYSTDTTSIRYYPMSVGNVYVYQWFVNGLPPSSGKLRRFIQKDTIINSKKYYKIVYSPQQSYWSRTDSTTGSYYEYSPGTISCFRPNGNDLLEDSLALTLHSTYVCGSATHECSDISLINVFGQVRSVKSLGYSSIGVGQLTKYAIDIGPIYHISSSHGSSGTESLLGCVINGVVYGDTTFYPSSVNLISAEIPLIASLNQNYPNPFNPGTKIKFDISKTSFVKITIYNILGKLIAEIVNEELKPGSYETEWNASDLPSGMYFYKLKSGDFTETKKMILIK